jgi:hypothetical protein
VVAGHLAGTVASACDHQRLLPFLALCPHLGALHGNDRLHPAHLHLKAHQQDDSQEGKLDPISTCTTQTEDTNNIGFPQDPAPQNSFSKLNEDMLHAWRAVRSNICEQLLTAQSSLLFLCS